MRTPRLTTLEGQDTHRLVPSRYGDSVLTRIADDDAHLQDIFDLDHATNERLAAENDRLPGIGVKELVFDVPHYRIINAAFCHAHPLGTRFAGPDRGAWYAAFELATAQAEVIFHKTVALAEIGHFQDTITYDAYRATFSGDYHDLRDDAAFEDCLDPDSYVASQDLAAALLDAGALGIVYPAVRRPGGTNLACFRPAMVGHVRRGATYRLTWSGAPEPAVTIEAGVQPAARRARRSASDSAS